MHVVVADDGSTDRTVEVVKTIQESNANIEIISLGKNSGKSAALNQGLTVMTLLLGGETAAQAVTILMLSILAGAILRNIS